MYKEILREISLEYEKKRDRNNNEKHKRIRQVYKKIPTIEKIDE